jgi:hypothetical protein
MNGDDPDYDPVGESAIIKLRNHLTTNVRSSSYQTKVDIYRRTQRAIKAFMDREPLKLVKPCTDDLFPLTLL